MTKLVTFLLALTFWTPAFAKINGSAIGKILYPASQEDQAFLAQFFEIVELHKTQDPLLEGRGPSVQGFSLDKIKFAFMANETDTTVDLFFFNWQLPSFHGLEVHPKLSELYGSTVYALQTVDKKAIATQGENRQQLTNFSYLHGTQFWESFFKNANMEVPPYFKSWTPHPDFLKPSHPLRMALGTRVLVLLSPSKDLIFQQFGATEESRPHLEAYFESLGGFYNMIMGMMVHEIYHVKESDDKANGFTSERKIEEDRKALVETLNSDSYLKSLFITYAKIVFSLGDELKQSTPTKNEVQLLRDLNAVIHELKSKYPNAWNYIWAYEYTEGFAEYVSASSMIQVGVTSLARQIDLQKADHNNFAYRTGTIGGLYLAKRFQKMPFENNEDHTQSLWEIILSRSNATQKSSDIPKIISQYRAYPMNDQQEIDLVIEYLVSTVMD